MILLSINSTTKEITMTSFMRDMYVNIKGIDADGNDIDTWSKLNAAYVYGGAELLMDTIEYNFDIMFISTFCHSLISLTQLAVSSLTFPMKRPRA